MTVREPKCRLCSSKCLDVLYCYPLFFVECCRECSLVQVSEKPSEASLDSLYNSSYFNKGKYVQDLAIQKEQQRRMGLLDKTGISKGSKVLDIGCATGDFLGVAKGYYNVWGQDISRFAINVASENYPELEERLQVGSIEKLDYSPASFDAITMWDVIEHLWDPKTTIGIVKQWLRPGGVLFISTPNIGAPIARLMGRYWAFMTPPEHLIFFQRTTMRQILNEHGFTEFAWMSKGKWVNSGFLVYKLHRVMPLFVSKQFVNWFTQSSFGGNTLYVPTGDIMYVSAKF